MFSLRNKKKLSLNSPQYPLLSGALLRAKFKYQWHYLTSISEGMSELQATLEFSVELNKFYNVDLFQRG